MGILEFVFGKGAPKDDTAPKQAYYLNDDDAKTFGDIDYMRSSRTVRRTFAKKKGQTELMESVREISSMAPKAKSTAPAAESTSPIKSTPSIKSTPTPARRKPASGDMDMFRNMAKDIRK